MHHNFAHSTLKLNPFILSLSLSEYPVAEECLVRVFSDNVLLAMTTFTFYQVQQPHTDLMLQLLNSQLQGYFGPVSQSGQGGLGATSGSQVKQSGRITRMGQEGLSLKMQGDFQFLFSTIITCKFTMCSHVCTCVRGLFPSFPILLNKDVGGLQLRKRD